MEQQHETDSKPLAQMPVELTITVGSVAMPLQQLIEMSAGQTLTTEVNSFFPKVQLHCGSRLVAEGELVRVEDRVGFRVTRLLS
ncbi:MAG: FliM/FliN family flagellar motor switch protein [Alphaproteobacteria bacterium]|nr:FliM/FliN family flagellar motor switch protein [Alphaproteobacteria bacterium]